MIGSLTIYQYYFFKAVIGSLFCLPGILFLCPFTARAPYYLGNQRWALLFRLTRFPPCMLRKHRIIGSLVLLTFPGRR